jgi:hypothetical protein
MYTHIQQLRITIERSWSSAQQIVGFQNYNHPSIGKISETLQDPLFQ